VKAKPKNIDDYLAGVSDEKRVALTKLRKAIHAAAPGLEECISYSVPAFRSKGKVVAGFGVNKEGLSYFPFSGTVLKAFAREIEGYGTTTGTIRFPANEPLPVALVRKLVRARIAEEKDSGT
jgi:uncharacterized protein YdhG (YjbR/CyaY superfamily)